MTSLRVPNRTRIRWSNNHDSKRPYVVERHENCREHHKAGTLEMTTFTVVVVGRYTSEESAERAAYKSAMIHGGFAQGMRGLLGLFAAPAIGRGGVR